MTIVERYNFAFLFYAIGLLTTIFRNSQGLQQQACQRNTNCKFTCSNIPGRTSDVIIDLSTLDGKVKPRFTNIKDADKRAYVYDWNPCTIFTITPGTGCSGVNACQISSSGVNHFNIGELYTMYYQADTFYIVYTKGVSGKTTNVTLAYKDGEEGAIYSVRENPPNHYSMTLYTKYAPYSGSGSGSGGISAGTVLLIIFFTLVLLYFGIGIAYLKYHRGAEGKDMVPNYEFWSKIPGLIKDGCVFSAKKLKECFSSLKEKTGKGEQGEYEKI